MSTATLLFEEPDNRFTVRHQFSGGEITDTRGPSLGRFLEKEASSPQVASFMKDLGLHVQSFHSSSILAEYLRDEMIPYPPAWGIREKFICCLLAGDVPKNPETWKELHKKRLGASVYTYLYQSKTWHVVLNMADTLEKSLVCRLSDYRFLSVFSDIMLAFNGNVFIAPSAPSSHKKEPSHPVMALSPDDNLTPLWQALDLSEIPAKKSCMPLNCATACLKPSLSIS